MRSPRRWRLMPARPPREQPLGPEGGPFQGFQPLFEIGRGCYGAVYLLQHADGRKAVDKRVKLDNLKEKEKTAALRETEVLRRCNHDHIISYRHSYHSTASEDGPGLWSGRHHELLHIIMDYCDGGTVEDSIKEQKACNPPRPVAPPLARRWIYQVTSALGYLHSQRVIHRDIKPANIFLDEANGRVDAKLGDFGISRVLNDDTVLANTAVGTPYYMSPEARAAPPAFCAACVLRRLSIHSRRLTSSCRFRPHLAFESRSTCTARCRRGV